eukprot:symbB.v1.2.035043.t1/scaffold4521.1/size38550/1
MRVRTKPLGHPRLLGPPLVSLLVQ